jgi:Zn-dependent protease with chaperone function
MKTYFIDGKTSKRRECTITLLNKSIFIAYIDDMYNMQTSTWHIGGILKLDIRTTSRSLKYGDFPHEILEFYSEEDFNTFILQYPNALFHQSAYNKFTSFGWKGIASVIVGVVIFSLLFFIYGAPFIADSFARSIPKEYETFIGDNFQQTYLQYQTLDSLKSEQIQQFYDHMKLESDYNISVVVVDSDIINAFALPGGFIVVYAGILDMIENEGELAGLLAHEVSHINGRHSLRTVSKDLAMYLLLASLTGDMGGFSSVLIENSNMISTLSFSRKFEKEADLEGLNILVESKIDPIGMVNLFQKFETLNNSIKKEYLNTFSLDSTEAKSLSDSTRTSTWGEFYSGKVTELLSTHPEPKNRIEYLKHRISGFDKRPNFPKKDSLKYYFTQLKTNQN